MIRPEDLRTIEYDYSHAKHKEEQIQILAEEYGVETWEVRKALAERGAYKITSQTIEKIKERVNKGTKLSQIHNYVSEVSDCRVAELNRLLKDWNKHRWDESFAKKAPETEEAPDKTKKVIVIPKILIDCATERLRGLDVQLDELMEKLRECESQLAEKEKEKAELTAWLEAAS